MQWELLIIPLIAVGVWILGTLFKTGEEEIGKKGRSSSRWSSGANNGTPAGDGPRAFSGGRPASPREEERQKVSAEPAPQPTISRPPLSERPARPRERPRPTPPVLREEEVPVAIPVARLVSEPVVLRKTPTEAERSRAARAALQRSAARRAHHHTRYASLADRAAGAFAAEQTTNGGNGFRCAQIFDRPRCMRPADRKPLLAFRAGSGDTLMRAIQDYYVAHNAIVTGDIVLSAGVNIWFGSILRGDLAHHAWDRASTCRTAASSTPITTNRRRSKKALWSVIGPCCTAVHRPRYARRHGRGAAVRL